MYVNTVLTVLLSKTRRCYLTWVNWLTDKILPSEKKKWFISSIIVCSVFHLDQEFEKGQREDLCRNGRDIYQYKYRELYLKKTWRYFLSGIARYHQIKRRWFDLMWHHLREQGTKNVWFPSSSPNHNPCSGFKRRGRFFWETRRLQKCGSMSQRTVFNCLGSSVRHFLNLLQSQSICITFIVDFKSWDVRASPVDKEKQCQNDEKGGTQQLPLIKTEDKRAH